MRSCPLIRRVCFNPEKTAIATDEWPVRGLIGSDRGTIVGRNRIRCGKVNAVTFFWMIATLIAAAAQTARNAMQRSLTATLGTVGASQVRFLYGFPFALLFLLVLHAGFGFAVPAPSRDFLTFALMGAVMQILGTVLMLSSMKLDSFAVTTAYMKTEPVLVALTGVILLGDTLSAAAVLAIVTATTGVVVMTTKRGLAFASVGIKPAAFGIASGGCFALAAVSFRGGIIGLGDAPFFLRATTMLAWSLGLQSALLFVWLGLFDRQALTKSLTAWKPSLFAGFMGALASQFWFIGFSLTSAANVRTLALVEVLMAQAVSRGIFAQTTTARDYCGMALIVLGVGALLLVH
jgi:drug/metabolite transporter (DMT)-like permease